MDDLDFQRKAYAEPNCQDEDFVCHQKKLPKKQPLLDELKLLDSHLKRALSIMPPSGLVERIELNHIHLQHQFVRKQWIQAVMLVGGFVCVSILLLFFSYV